VILVTAGRTEEAIDPVRTLTNRSSGKMGFALASAARDLGASVILVTGAADQSPPPGVEVLAVRTAAEMQARVLGELERADALIMAAAVSDYRPRTPAREKIQRGSDPLVLELEPTADILLAAAGKKGRRIHVGFALETGNGGLERARRKLEAKQLDFVVLNGAEAIGQDVNAVVLVDRAGSRALPLAPKPEVAREVMAEVARRLGVVVPPAILAPPAGASAETRAELGEGSDR
jgi:phosphopantothenoylcysteine decarboxylase/phosphopantothenate--cysteine ligase